MARLYHMPIAEVVRLLDRWQSAGIPVWLDGGWAVDALIGHETRPHQDLDVVVEERHRAPLVGTLRADGYHPVDVPPPTPWNFVWADQAGHAVDLHVIVFDEAGDGVYGPVERGSVYPAASLTGAGVIADRPVATIAPEWLIAFHSGYALDADDIQDVRRLAAHFGLPVPPEFDAD